MGDNCKYKWPIIKVPKVKGGKTIYFILFTGSGVAYGNICSGDFGSRFCMNQCGNTDNVQSLLTCVAVSKELINTIFS